MFDIASEIRIPAPPRLGNEICKVRYPQDKEWYERNKARKILVRRLGRGKQQHVMPEPGEADLRLYEQITVNGSPPLTAAEANQILEAMVMFQVTGVEMADNVATVHAETMSGEVAHRVQVPTADQIVQYRRRAYKVIELPYGQQEFSIAMEAGADLWDSCHGEGVDYAGAVPGPHKDAAIRAVIEFIDLHAGPRAEDANF